MKRILLVEDDDGVRELIELMLADNGFDVVSTISRNEALEKLHLNPDIILMDRVMPGMECEPFMDAIKMQCPRSRVIMMSGNYDRCEAERLGIPIFIPKPFSTRELLSAVT